MSEQISEKTLVARIMSGDTQALRRYYEEYAPRITRFVYLKVDNEKDVEEIVSDTLISSLEAFRDFTFRSSIYTFVCSIAKRKIVDFYRKQKIKRIVFSQAPGVEKLFSILTTPEDQLDTKLIKQQIETTFTTLDPLYQKILKKKYIDELSVAEIANELSMTFKSVESKLFRARKAFCAQYSKEYRYNQ